MLVRSRRTPLFTVLAALALTAALAGCRGPKSSPDSTISSFMSGVTAGDYKALVEMSHPESIKVAGTPERCEAFLADYYGACRDYDYDIGETHVTGDGLQATVGVTCTCKIMDRHHELVSTPCSEAFQLKKQADGKWYVILPQGQRLRSTL